MSLLRPAPIALLILSPSLLTSACSDQKVGTFNAPPEAQITSPADGTTVLAGSLLTLRGAASDANDAASELTTRWFVDDVEACAGATPAADGSTTCELTVPDGTALTVRLEVTDPGGAAGTDSVTLNVTPNATPTATIVSPVADGVYYSDQLLTFRGTVADTEDDAESLSAWWEDGATRLEAVEATPTSAGEVLGYTTLPEGPHALELHVLDSAGNEGIATVLIDVGPPNSAPTCSIVAPIDGGASEDGERVDFAAAVSDADVAADQLTVEWSSDKDGVIGTSTPDTDGSVDFATSTLSVNAHRITLRVTDEVGATCTQSIGWTVGTAPTITLETPTLDELVNAGDNLMFSALVTDNEDVASDLLVTWESSLDGVIYEGPPDSTGLAQFIDSGVSVGDHVLTVTVTDTAGLFATALGSFTVNGGPSAPGVSLVPASPYTDDDLTVSIDTAAVDPDGDPVSYSYAWSVDGVASAASTTGNLPASATTRGEVWTVAVTASDGLTSSTAGVASVTIANSAPVASVSLTPSAPTRNSTLSCAGSASDADADSLVTSFAWTVDGSAVAATTSSAATSTLAGAFDADQTVSCTVTVTDTTGATGSATASLTIENTAPTVSVTLSPAVAKTDDTLTAAATASDPDGDALALSYDWYVDGALVQSGTSSTLDGSSAFSRDQDVYVIVTADDGTETSTGTSATLTIANTAPAVSAVTLSPTTPQTNDTLTATATTSDADADTLTLSYDWYVGGALAQSGPSDTLSGAAFSRGQSVYVTVVADDGTDTGGATSASVSIANTGPTDPLVGIMPTAPFEGDALTCAVTTASSDDDGDTLSYSFTWDVNGSAYTVASSTATSSTVPGAEVAYPDTWTCSVTASDGSATSTAATATVTVDFPYTCTSATYGSSDYLFCTDKLNWDDAEDACASWGGHLVTVNDATEEAWLLSSAQAVMSFAAGAKWWIGYTDAVYEGSFGWVSSSTATYTDWGSGEPNNSYGGSQEDCTVLIWAPSSYTSGSWNDLPCSGTVDSDQTFICEG
jgi:hypothetical protein